MSQNSLSNITSAISPEQMQQMGHCLRHLAYKTNSPLTMVTDFNGQPMIHQSRLSETQCTGLAALVAGSFVAGQEIGRFLGMDNDKAFKRLLLEGNVANLYILMIGTNMLLITAFTQTTPLGQVRYFAEQTQQELTQIIEDKQPVPAEANLQLDQAIGNAISRQLDQLFDGDLSTQ